MSAALDALTVQVARDLDRIAHPRMPWLEPRIGQDGEPALDVLVVGGGQSGLAIAFGLMRAQVRNILVVDKAAEGREGPWLTYARMRTLRSPKDFTGPDLDVPSLTYQAWHEARFGEASWQALDLIPKELWAEYLLWFRGATGVPVRNDTAVLDIAPADNGLLRVTLRARDGTTASVETRKVVLATGQEGAGRWATLPVLEALPPHLRAHTADEIDFAPYRGRRVAVIGAGASAFDNAATALEAGAEVTLLCRRAEVQVVQPYRWLTFAGFLRHLAELDDAWRWRFMRAVMAMREGFPQPTLDRCTRHPGFTLLEGAPVLAARARGRGLVLDTPHGPVEADLVISATGIETDFACRPELARVAANIARWSDRYAPPPHERDPRLGEFPYLDAGFAFEEREVGLTPWLRDIHLFAIASTVSFGPSGSSINAMTTAVPKLVAGVTRGLFTADLDRHWASFQAYDVPQAVVDRAALAAGRNGTGFAKMRVDPVAPTPHDAAAD